MAATRREFLAAGAAGLVFWPGALTARARAPFSSYGALQAPDARGLMLPPGFRSREIARAGRLVKGYPWHIFCDGQATFATEDGGWILVSNSESIAATGAGSSAIRFSKNGTIRDAYRILAGTNANCAGGRTPWGTWLSCEEYDLGHVWECAPGQPGQGTMRPALGSFNHEAVAVDPVGKQLYMTEDRPDGALYRFTPEAYPDLTAGKLELMVTGGWAEVPDPAGIFTPTRRQVPGTRHFSGGEGIWYDDGTIYFSTKGDNRVWAYGTVGGMLEVIYDQAQSNGPLSGVDNLTVSRAGEIFVCEDGGNMEICVIEPGGTVAPFLRLTGAAAEGLPQQGNELAGVIFDPAGERLYFSAQRAFGLGAIYEVTGPFAAGTPVPAPRAGRLPDAKRRRLQLRAPRRISLAALRRRGLPLTVRAGSRARITVALRTDDLDSVPGARGSVRRPVTVTLARRRFRGTHRRLRLRVSAREARALRAVRPLTVQVAVTARFPDGLTRVDVQRVRVR